MLSHAIAIIVVALLCIVGLLNIIIGAWKATTRDDDAAVSFYGGVFLLIVAQLVAQLGGL